MDSNTEQILLSAIKRHQNGNLEDAEKLYHSILAFHPKHADANHNLGVLKISGSKPEAALPFFVAALQANPEVSQFWLSYIDALIRLGQREDAKSALRQAGTRLNFEHRAKIKTLLSSDRISETKMYDRGGAKGRLREKKDKKSPCRDAEIHSPSGSRPPETKIDIDYIHALYNSGQYLAAKNASGIFTKKHPSEVAGWKTLLAIYVKLGDLTKALAAARQAVRLAPEDAECQNNYGVILKDLGHLPQARKAFETAVLLDPNVARYHYNIGTLNQASGEADAAETNYLRSIKLDPGLSEALNNLGIIQIQREAFDEAIVSFQAAISGNPGNAEAYYNYGTALLKKGKLAEAETQCMNALYLRANYIDVFKQLALIYEKQSRLQDSEDTLGKAILLSPKDDSLYFRLANILTQRGHYEAAETMYRQAIAINHKNHEAFRGLADLLFDRDRTTEAKQNYEKAIRLNSSSPEALNNLGMLLLEEGAVEQALDYFHKAHEIQPTFMSCLSNIIFGMNYVGAVKSEDILPVAQTFGSLICDSVKIERKTRVSPTVGRPISIGFVSGDFRTHPVALFLLSILSAIDRSQISVHAYYNNDFEDELTEKLKGRFDRWANIFSLDDTKAAEIIKNDGIHILIDLSGHTAKNRLGLFAHRVSPIQISWLGYCGTTGMQEIDYVIGDPYVISQEEEKYFVEKIFRLPETYWCFTAPEFDLKVERLPALDNGYITFGCFNNLSKINEEVIKLWAKIVIACPGSKLFLKTRRLSDKMVEKTFRRRFAHYGVESNRLIIEGLSTRSDYFRTYNRVDIALDPFPFPGGTTSIEGLWMGVPFMTRKGDRFYSRNGETILHNIGLSDWIADDNDDYIRKVIGFATDLNALSEMRKSLRERILASPLFDADRFARNFEKAMFDIWERFCSQIID